MLHAKTKERRTRIYDFLNKNPIGILATVDPNCDPHGSVIYFSTDSAGNICFITKRLTKKSDNLAHHNRAMLVVYEPVKQTTVQVSGPVREITDLVDSQIIFTGTLKASMDTSDSRIIPVAKLVAGDYVAYRLEPAQVRMAVYARPDGGREEKIFEVLEAYDLNRTG